MLNLVPFSLEAEEAVCGSALLDPDVADRVAFLKPAMFHDDEMRAVWRAVVALRERRVAADFLSVRRELEVGEYTPPVTAHRIAGLLNAVPTSTHAEHYAGIVRETWQRRSLIDAGSRIAALGYDAANLDEAMTSATRVLDAIDAGDVDADVLDMRAAIDATVEASNQANRLGVTTGLTDLDRIIGGFKPGKLYTVAGATSVGKSLTANNFALAVVRTGARVAWWSGEMGAEELVQRMAATMCGVDNWHIEQGQMDDGERERYFVAMDWLNTNAEVDFFVGAEDIHSLCGRVRRLHRARPYGLVIVDYMQQLVDGAENLPALVGQVSSNLKRLARSLDVPVIGYSQLSREINKRADKRPQLSDLYQSGRLEQDSDVVVGLYREGYYDDDPPVQGEMELLVRKHRGGRRGVARVYYHMPTLRLGNLAKGV